MKLGFVGCGMLLVLATGCDPITAVESESGSTSGSTGSGVTTSTSNPSSPTLTGATDTMASVGVSTAPPTTTDTATTDSTTSSATVTTAGETSPGSTGMSTGGASESSTGFIDGTGSTGWGSTWGSTGGSSSSSESDTAGFIAFVDPSESGGGVDCDPYAQDCMEGEKCNAWASSGSSWDALSCFPVVDDPSSPGEACSTENGGTSGLDSCEVASMCWNVDGETGAGTCVAMCQGSPAMPSCADPSTTCVIQNDGVLNLCLPTCDPLVQGCPGDEACYFIGDDFVCAPDASGEDFGGEGDPCEFINACEAGFSCANSDSYGGCGGAAGCCTAFCDTSEPNTCAVMGHMCIAVFEDGEAPTGLENTGLCGFPA